MSQTISSPEHIAACLGRIRAAGVIYAPATEPEWKATLAVFVDSLKSCHPLDVRSAAQWWAESESKWPSLAAFIGAVNAAKRRREPPRVQAVAGSSVAQPKRPIIRDPSAMRRTIMDLRANPKGYALASVLADMGEDMLADAGEP